MRIKIVDFNLLSLKGIIQVFFIIPVFCQLRAQPVDTIQVGFTFDYPNEANEFTYIVYSEKDNNKKPSVIIKSAIKPLNLNVQSHLEISHYWHNPDSRQNGNFHSLVGASTFRPITHIRNTAKGTEAYDFSALLITS